MSYRVEPITACTRACKENPYVPFRGASEGTKRERWTRTCSELLKENVVPFARSAWGWDVFDPQYAAVRSTLQL